MTATGPQSSYFHHFLNVEHRNGLDLLKILWQTSFSSLLQWPEWIRAVMIVKPPSQEAAEAIRAHQNSFQAVWNFVTMIFFVSGVVWMFVKREWKLLSILLFWLGYVSIHAAQRVLLDRYTIPVIWLTLLTAVYGLTCSVRWAADRAPKWLLAAVATIGTLIAVFWTLHLWPAVGSTARISAESATVVYVGCLLLLIGLVVKQLLYRRESLFWDVCLMFVAMTMIVSNQFTLAFRLEQGNQDIEFKKLAEWYVENAGENEKLVTTMKGVVEIFAPGREKLILHTGGVPGKDIAEFAQNCIKRKVTYVAWDSRLGLVPNDEYYQLWGLQKVHPLGSGKDVGPFKFIQKIEGNPRRYINLYRLVSEDPPAP